MVTSNDMVTSDDIIRELQLPGMSNQPPLQSLITKLVSNNSIDVEKAKTTDSNR